MAISCAGSPVTETFCRNGCLRCWPHLKLNRSHPWEKFMRDLDTLEMAEEEGRLVTEIILEGRSKGKPSIRPEVRPEVQPEKAPRPIPEISPEKAPRPIPEIAPMSPVPEVSPEKAP